MITTWESTESATEPAVRKAARREAKKQRKHDEDARRRLDAAERYDALWDAIDLKRKIVDIGDTKARLALTIMGALNAAVFVLLFRGAGGASLSASARPWFVGLLLVYGMVTFHFVVQAIEALRPRLDSRSLAADALRVRDPLNSSDGDAGVRGLFFVLEEAPPSLDEELRMWTGATAHDVNAELVVMNRGVNELVLRQFRALERVYGGLKALLVLATTIVVFAAAAGLLQAGG